MPMYSFGSQKINYASEWTEVSTSLQPIYHFFKVLGTTENSLKWCLPGMAHGLVLARCRSRQGWVPDRSAPAQSKVG